jgi:hypothetical protein
MNALTQGKKFTVICSAYQHTADSLTNMLATDEMAKYLTAHIFVEYTRVVGVYRGQGEQSFVINTNSSSAISNITRYCQHIHNQECVLVSNNQRHSIKLHFEDGSKEEIGHNFGVHGSKPSAKVDSYTVLNGNEYYVVY